MDLQTELLLALSLPKNDYDGDNVKIREEKEEEEEKEEDEEERIIGMYYDIDELKNIRGFDKINISSFFRIQSSSLAAFRNYYYENYNIKYEDEDELTRRISNIGKSRMYNVIDPFHRYDFVDPKKRGIKDWKYRDDKYHILSNNEKLFKEVLKILGYQNGGTMSKLGLSNYIEEREIGKWYCMDIRKHLDFKISNKMLNGIVSLNILDQTVYYSFIHKLWGFEWNNFKTVYNSLIGHPYDHEERIIKRLEKTINSEDYAVIESHLKTVLIVKDKSKFQYVSEEMRIVSDDKLLFVNYLPIVPLFRKGYRNSLPC
jgi:hypothetical protein